MSGILNLGRWGGNEACDKLGLFFYLDVEDILLFEEFGTVPLFFYLLC
jgi:hypothetical protein